LDFEKTTQHSETHPKFESFPGKFNAFKKFVNIHCLKNVKKRACATFSRRRYVHGLRVAKDLLVFKWYHIGF